MAAPKKLPIVVTFQYKGEVVTTLPPELREVVRQEVIRLRALAKSKDAT